MDDGVGVLAVGRGPAALAEAVRSLFEGDLDARRRAARERVLALHTWDAVFRRQLHFYENLLASRTGAATDTLRYA